MEPAAAKYLKRMAVASVAYLILLIVAILVAQYLPSQWQAVPLVLVLPTIYLVIRAVRSLWQESDEFGRSNFQQSFSLGFVISAPVLLIIGILEAVGAFRIRFIFAFAIVMIAWAIGMSITQKKYR